MELAAPRVLPEPEKATTLGLAGAPPPPPPPRTVPNPIALVVSVQLDGSPSWRGTCAMVSITIVSICPRHSEYNHSK